MEYVFGTKNDAEVLKIKGDHPTDLTGFHQIEQEYPDQTITDNFRIVRKIGTDRDVEGSYYDWYEIDRHYRVRDKTGPLAEKSAEQFADMENALCEQDAAMDERMSTIEDAICELDAAINQ